MFPAGSVLPASRRRRQAHRDILTETLAVTATMVEVTISSVTLRNKRESTLVPMVEIHHTCPALLTAHHYSSRHCFSLFVLARFWDEHRHTNRMVETPTGPRLIVEPPTPSAPSVDLASQLGGATPTMVAMSHRADTLAYSAYALTVGQTDAATSIAYKPKYLDHLLSATRLKSASHIHPVVVFANLGQAFSTRIDSHERQ